MRTKYVVVLGSLLSGLGKGIVTSSITKILSFYGYNAMPMKFDGYLNYDCGTMNPFRHGEVFVLDDKSEVDMDFGNYERFLGRDITGDFSLTGGKIFSTIISRERRGDFLGNDVQFIPHVTDYVINKIEETSKNHDLDVMIIEVGGTVGDIESSYFIEAMRQLALRHETVFVDLTYVPKLDVVGEQKTKPTQLAIRSIMQSGITPNFIICRSADQLDEDVKTKIANFANIPGKMSLTITISAAYTSSPTISCCRGLTKNFLVLWDFNVQSSAGRSTTHGQKGWRGYRTVGAKALSCR